MGAVYKKKKRSCPCCKPNKVGWAKKFSKKELEKRKATKKEMEEGK